MTARPATRAPSVHATVLPGHPSGPYQNHALLFAGHTFDLLTAENTTAQIGSSDASRQYAVTAELREMDSEQQA